MNEFDSYLISDFHTSDHIQRVFVLPKLKDQCVSAWEVQHHAQCHKQTVF
jgi:hypothetical protein